MTHQVIFVGPARTGPPFSTPSELKLIDELGDFANRCGWISMRACPPQELRSAELLVACGKAAERWVQHHVNHSNILILPHPSYIYSKAMDEDRFKVFQQTIKSIKEKYDDKKEK